MCLPTLSQQRIPIAIAKVANAILTSPARVLFDVYTMRVWMGVHNAPGAAGVSFSPLGAWNFIRKSRRNPRMTQYGLKRFPSALWTATSTTVAPVAVSVIRTFRSDPAVTILHVGHKAWRYVRLPSVSSTVAESERKTTRHHAIIQYCHDDVLSLQFVIVHFEYFGLISKSSTKSCCRQPHFVLISNKKVWQFNSWRHVIILLSA